MRRSIAVLVVAAAGYGFSIGLQHSLRFACWNAVKFPFLISLTGALCTAAYYLSSRFITRALDLREVADLAVATYRDVAVLLASLTPLVLFLATTVRRPGRDDLGEYPLFLGLNVAFIAVSGCVALLREARVLVTRHRLGRRRAALLLASWLGLSLFAGGQCAWYLRPFFCPASITAPPLVEGTNPDYRGARSIYEAVYHLLDPPPLPAGYVRHGSRQPPVADPLERYPCLE